MQGAADQMNFDDLDAEGFEVPEDEDFV
jgi:hypothetical protein